MPHAIARGFAAAAALAVLAAAGASHAGPEKVKFPADYATSFERYDEVDLVPRKVVRYYFANRAALEAAKPGKPAPEGTTILMEDHKAKLGPDGQPVVTPDGRFIPEPAILDIVVQEKEKGWGAEYPAEKRNGEWEYAVFSPAGELNTKVKYDSCFACHKQARAGRDYTFTFAKYILDHPAKR